MIPTVLPALAVVVHDPIVPWHIKAIVAGLICIAFGFPMMKSDTILAVLGVPLVITGLFTAVAIPIFPESSLIGDRERIDQAALQATINDHYTLTGTTEPHDSAETIEALCQPVTAASPELRGVADGREIRFRVGIEDCRGEDPTAEIIVVESDPSGLSAADLEK